LADWEIVRVQVEWQVVMEDAGFFVVGDGG
jgi:hypothetical protein